MRGGARRVVVAFLLDDVRSAVGLELLVDQRGAAPQRRLEVHERLERLDVDGDVRERVFGHVAALGHDHGDRLAHVAGLVLDQRHLGAGVEHEARDRRRGDEQRAGLPVIAEVVGRVHRDDARAPPCRGDVDAAQSCVGVLAPQERHVQHAIELHVVHEERAAREEPRVLRP